MPASAPCHMNMGIRLYLPSRHELSSSSCHLSATRGVSGQCLLCETAILHSVCEVSTTGALVDMVARFVLAACQLVPVVAEGLSLAVCDTSIFGSGTMGLMLAIPEGGKPAGANVVPLVSQADGTDGRGKHF